MASTGNQAVVCVHAGFGQARLIGVVLCSTATFFALQDIVKNQVNARRIATDAIRECEDALGRIKTVEE